MRERGVDPFRVLVSTILSHRTRDEVTQRASLRLLKHYPTPSALSTASTARIASLIREVGLAKPKSKGLRRASMEIVGRFGGVVPQKTSDLLSLPMVGPKTAHAVRVFGYQADGLPVDVHILRVARRLGVVKSGSIVSGQLELAAEVPRRYWRLLNPVLVQHGQNLCRATVPLCNQCPIQAWCARAGV